jgi:hypothetical protein
MGNTQKSVFYNVFIGGNEKTFPEWQNADPGVNRPLLVEPLDKPTQSSTFGRPF